MRSEFALVVGTTPDYIAKIHRRYPGEAVFVVDRPFRGDPLLEGVPESALLFVSLEDFPETLEAVRRFCTGSGTTPAGVACFDCESLMAASGLARRLGKRAPAPQAIARTRDKSGAKAIWRKAGVPTPRGILASNLKQTLGFFADSADGVVVKPISGSGSELTFRCETEQQVGEAVGVLEEELPRRRGKPLFRSVPMPFDGTHAMNPCAVWLVEEFVRGPEFSCDFLLRDGVLSIVRETGKLKALDQTFGSVLAYTFPPRYPEGLDREGLIRVLRTAATSIGFEWGHFMVDFIVQDGRPVILEIAPRPGGDSIPDLVEVATGKDLLGVHLDFVCGRSPLWAAPPMRPESFASVNLFASREGVIAGLDVSGIRGHPGVRAIFMKKRVGDVITLPPADYDNRLLGFCVVAAAPGEDLMTECLHLSRAARASISPIPFRWATHQDSGGVLKKDGRAGTSAIRGWASG